MLNWAQLESKILRNYGSGAFQLSLRGSDHRFCLLFQKLTVLKAMPFSRTQLSEYFNTKQVQNKNLPRKLWTKVESYKYPVLVCDKKYLKVQFFSRIDTKIYVFDFPFLSVSIHPPNLHFPGVVFDTSFPYTNPLGRGSSRPSTSTAGWGHISGEADGLKDFLINIEINNIFCGEK